jgi:hypothetical protein
MAVRAVHASAVISINLRAAVGQFLRQRLYVHNNVLPRPIRCSCWTGTPRFGARSFSAGCKSEVTPIIEATEYLLLGRGTSRS